MSNSKAAATFYPITSPERRSIVQRLGNLAAELDHEARLRTVRAETDERLDLGSWNSMVADELARSAGTVRFVATLVIQGGMSIARAKMWLVSTQSFVKLVRRADAKGVIQ